LRILVPTTFFRREKNKILVDGENKKNRLDECSTFEKMGVTKDSVGSLKP